MLGAGANCSGELSVTIGKGASVSEANCVALLGKAYKSGSQAIGVGSSASGVTSTAIGHGAMANKEHSIAIGFNAISNDNCAVVFASYNSAARDYKTQLYFSGANSPLANEYYYGEALMGYTVTDSAGAVVACGTRRLSELFPDNSLTQPASLDENGEWVMPKVFHPSDLDMPQEEPSEPEEYTPLPVWPIVEPEIEEMQ